MKNITQYIFLMLIGVIVLTGCTFEASDNGDLDGYWHIEQIEDLQTKQIEDTHFEHRFWAIQNHLLVFRNTDTGYQYILRFNHQGNTLVLSDPYFYKRIPGDEPLDDPAPLFEFGCMALKVTYSVEKLNNSHMILNDGSIRVIFRKL